MSEVREMGPDRRFESPSTYDPVAAHLSRRVVIRPVDCTPGAALEAMLESGQRHVAVVDPGGVFVGTVSAAIVAASGSPTLEGLASSPPVHLSQTSSMHDAASLMLTHGVDAVGALDRDGRVIGILTWSDILESVSRRGRP